ncbi:MAG: hypothetical protein IJL58_08065 [Bacteroidales bacterium]|nr:hypothetical protein [Bacteroidales bacterium]MBQ6185341.1 hypothetical protein [Bacteroidales bacterium]
MKRDLTNSRTYLPPRVRVVEICPEQSIILSSKEIEINSYVDESHSMDMEAASEKTWIIEF